MIAAPDEYLRGKTDVDSDSGCIIWTKGKNRGYARVKIQGKSYYLHKILWERVHGPTPPGYVLDHTCHTEDTSCPGGVTCRHRGCINTDHLELVTEKENQHRGRQRDRNWNKTQCPHGHPYNEENTYHYTTARGTAARGCKECRRRVRREYYTRNGI